VTYLDPDVISDETTVAEAILASIADQIPGWEPAEGSPETAMGEAMAIVAATIATLLKDEERDNYAGFGELILGLPRGAAGTATALTTWTLGANPDGYTIPAGSEAVWESPISGDPIAFATTGDYFVPAGQLVAANIAVTALEPGEAANGCVGDATEFDDLDVGVANVTMPAESSGGSEEEPVEDYVNRVADRARRIRAIPVTADDYAAAALDIPEVDRAVAINLLDPANPPIAPAAPSSVGHITVIPITAAGQPLTGPPLAALTASYATADRPLAVQVHVIEPTYTELTIVVTVRVAPDADTPTVLAAVEAAVTEALDPKTWGLDESLGGRWRLPARDVDKPVRAYDISTVADGVDGVAGVTAVTINGAASVDLPGWAGLPDLLGVDAVAA
jgi:uncharacterized phage protein gp47/JayE